MNRIAIFAAIVAGLTCAGGASAQSDPYGRLERLEAGAAGLAARLGGDAPAHFDDPAYAQDVQMAQATPMSPSLATDFEIRLQRLERTLSELTGRVEEANWGLNQLKDRVERMNGDIDFRLTQVENGKTSGGSAPAAPKTAEAPPSKPAAPAQQGQLGTLKSGQQTAAATQAPSAADPQRQYEQAFDLLRQSNYDAAERAFTDFLAKNKSHSLAGNAQYWLGETYFVRNRFAEAAKAFADGVQTYPKNNKAPDNLLKLGMSLALLKQTSDACVAYKQLGVRYPDAAASIKRRAETERRKLNCPV